MLPGQPLVRGQHDDAIKRLFPTKLLQVVTELKDVDVHQQGFTATGGVPKCQLGQAILCKWRQQVFPALTPLVQRGIEHAQVGIEIGKQAAGITKPSIQVDFCEQQGEILKILPFDLRFALAVDGVGMPGNVLVVVE